MLLEDQGQKKLATRWQCRTNGAQQGVGTSLHPQMQHTNVAWGFPLALGVGRPLVSSAVVLVGFIGPYWSPV